MPLLPRQQLQSGPLVDNGPIDTPKDGKVAYAIIASISLFILVFCLSRKLKILNWRALGLVPGIQWTILSVYIIAIIFILSATLLQFGFSLNVPTHCKAGIYLCLVFYLGAKIVMYLFLAERLHIIHAVHKRRKDRLHIFNVITITAGFGVIAILAFIYPVSQVSSIDGLCRIGIKRGATVPLLVYDLLINIWLTSCFVSYVRPFMQKITPNWWNSHKQEKERRQAEKGPVPEPRNGDYHGLQGNNPVADATFRALAINSLLGCILVLSTTIANLTLVLIYQGHELGWVCFLVCSIDTTWGVCVIHWMTRNASKPEDAIVRVQQRTSITTVPFEPRPEPSSRSGTPAAGSEPEIAQVVTITKPPVLHIKHMSENEGSMYSSKSREPLLSLKDML